MISQDESSAGLKRRYETPRLPAEVVETVCIIYRAAVASGLEPLEIIVFGSWVRGDYLRTSDLDVVIVSEHCPPTVNLPPDELYTRLAREKPPIWPEMLCYTPDRLKQAIEAPTILRDASRYWVRLDARKLSELCSTRC